MNKTIRYTLLLIIVAALVGLIAWYKSTPGQYDQLATCLKDSGTKFYGAFWCPHCQATKKMFGKSVKKLPYIECSAPDGQSQLPVCKNAHIAGYPTWEFANTFTVKKTDADISVLCKEPFTADQPRDCESSAPGTWDTIIAGRQYLSTVQPTIKDGLWNFPVKSRINGETTVDLLSNLSMCPIK